MVVVVVVVVGNDDNNDNDSGRCSVGRHWSIGVNCCTSQLLTSKRN